MQPGDRVTGPRHNHLGERVGATFVGFVTVQVSIQGRGGPPRSVLMAQLRTDDGTLPSVLPRFVPTPQPARLVTGQALAKCECRRRFRPARGAPSARVGSVEVA
jgi:hypothetical protein